MRWQIEWHSNKGKHHPSTWSGLLSSVWDAWFTLDKEAELVWEPQPWCGTTPWRFTVLSHPVWTRPKLILFKGWKDVSYGQSKNKPHHWKPDFDGLSSQKVPFSFLHGPCEHCEALKSFRNIRKLSGHHAEGQKESVLCTAFQDMSNN